MKQDPRADFEAWCREEYNNPGMERTLDGYAHSATHQCMPITYASVQMLWEAYRAGYQAALGSQEVKAMRGMSDCMHTARSELIELGIIDEKVPPMFVVDAVLEKVKALRDALVIAEDMLCKQENELRSFGAYEPCAESAILTARAALAAMGEKK